MKGAFFLDMHVKVRDEPHNFAGHRVNFPNENVNKELEFQRITDTVTFSSPHPLPQLP